MSNQGLTIAITCRVMQRLRQLSAQRKVNQVDRALAELRAKVQALPADKREAFAKEIQAMVKEQAHARNELSEALDDRYKR
jgi:outer membrane murein-binding lipoprotein Lpp